MKSPGLSLAVAQSDTTPKPPASFFVTQGPVDSSALSSRLTFSGPQVGWGGGKALSCSTVPEC